MSGQTYNSMAPSGIEQRPYTALSAIDNTDRDFMSKQANLQSLEAMMRQQQQSQAELERYRGETPGMVDKSNYEGAWARQRMDPSFLESQMRGQMGEHQSKVATGEFDRATNPGKISLTNATQRNDEMSKVGQFMQMVHASHGPEAADQLYQQVRTGLDPQVQARMPARYDPKNWDAMLEEASKTGPARAASNLSKQNYTQDLDKIGKQKDSDLAREELQQIGHKQRTEAEIQGRANVARIQRDSQEAKETPQRAMARLRRALTVNPDDEDAAFEYKMYLEDQWDNRAKTDPSIMILRSQATMGDNPEVQKRAQETYANERNSFFGEKGFEHDAPKKGEIRPGKDGKSYRFKGGFGRKWRDKSSWELVN